MENSGLEVGRLEEAVLADFHPSREMGLVS